VSKKNPSSNRPSLQVVELFDLKTIGFNQMCLHCKRVYDNPPDSVVLLDTCDDCNLEIDIIVPDQIFRERNGHIECLVPIGTPVSSEAIIAVREDSDLKKGPFDGRTQLSVATLARTYNAHARTRALINRLTMLHKEKQREIEKQKQIERHRRRLRRDALRKVRKDYGQWSQHLPIEEPPDESPK
jgi:hypothetical protein